MWESVDIKESAHMITSHNGLLSVLTQYSLFLTDNWYTVISQQHEESTGGDSHPHRAQRSSSGHTRISRAVLGGGLTIDTLPDNMTRVVVSATPQCFSWTLWLVAFIIFLYVLFVLVGVETLPSFGKYNVLFSTHLEKYMTSYDLTICLYDTPSQPLILCASLSGRRILASTTHGVVLAQKTSVRRNYG